MIMSQRARNAVQEIITKGMRNSTLNVLLYLADLSDNDMVAQVTPESIASKIAVDSAIAREALEILHKNNLIFTFTPDGLKNYYALMIGRGTPDQAKKELKAILTGSRFKVEDGQAAALIANWRCGNEEIQPAFNWTKERPIKQGWYGLRNYRIEGDTGISEEPTIVEVYRCFGGPLEFTFTGNDSTFGLNEVAEGEWKGPLTFLNDQDESDSILRADLKQLAESWERNQEEFATKAKRSRRHFDMGHNGGAAAAFEVCALQIRALIKDE